MHPSCFTLPPTGWLIGRLPPADTGQFSNEKRPSLTTPPSRSRRRHTMFIYLLTIVFSILTSLTHPCCFEFTHVFLLRVVLFASWVNHQKEENALKFRSTGTSVHSSCTQLIRRSGFLRLWVVLMTGEFTSTVICTAFSRQMNKRKKLFSNSEIFPKSLHLQNFLLQQAPRCAVHFEHYRAAIIQQPSPG